MKLEEPLAFLREEKQVMSNALEKLAASGKVHWYVMFLHVAHVKTTTTSNAMHMELTNLWNPALYNI